METYQDTGLASHYYPGAKSTPKRKGTKVVCKKGKGKKK
jgi:hypothetical protein